MKKLAHIAFALLASLSTLKAQESPKEEDFYKIVTPPIPEGIILEVGGLTTMPNGSLAISTRRGEVWIVDNPTSRTPFFRKFATGLHEILGLAYKEGALYCAQRGELTKLVDKNGDGKVSLDEAPEPMKNFFDRIDADADGFITAAEAAAARARRQAQGGGPGGGPGGPGAGGNQ